MQSSRFACFLFVRIVHAAYLITERKAGAYAGSNSVYRCQGDGSACVVIFDMMSFGEALADAKQDSDGFYLILLEHRLLKCTAGQPTSSCVTVAGKDGKGVGLKQLGSATAFHLDGDGNFIIMDRGNARIVRCSAADPDSDCAVLVLMIGYGIPSHDATYNFALDLDGSPIYIKRIYKRSYFPYTGAYTVNLVRCPLLNDIPVMDWWSESWGPAPSGVSVCQVYTLEHLTTATSQIDTEIIAVKPDGKYILAATPAGGSDDEILTCEPLDDMSIGCLAPMANKIPNMESDLIVASNGDYISFRYYIAGEFRYKPILVSSTDNTWIDISSTVLSINQNVRPRPKVSEDVPHVKSSTTSPPSTTSAISTCTAEDNCRQCRDGAFAIFNGSGRIVDGGGYCIVNQNGECVDVYTREKCSADDSLCPPPLDENVEPYHLTPAWYVNCGNTGRKFVMGPDGCEDRGDNASGVCAVGA